MSTLLTYFMWIIHEWGSNTRSQLLAADPSHSVTLLTRVLQMHIFLGCIVSVTHFFFPDNINLWRVERSCETSLTLRYSVSSMFSRTLSHYCKWFSCFCVFRKGSEVSRNDEEWQRKDSFYLECIRNRNIITILTFKRKVQERLKWRKYSKVDLCLLQLIDHMTQYFTSQP